MARISWGQVTVAQLVPRLHQAARTVDVDQCHGKELGRIAMLLLMYRCPNTGYRVQGSSAEDVSEDRYVYESVTPARYVIRSIS